MDFAASSTMSRGTSYACGSSEHNLLSATNATGTDIPEPQVRQRRRHSFFVPQRRKSVANQLMDGEEALLLKLDLFLSELERRMEYIENYCGEYSIDASIAKTYNTLQTVRNRCSQASEEVIGAGRRRLQVMVETLDARYHEALAATESMNDKARVGIDLLDSLLADIENRALKFRDQGLANAAGAAERMVHGAGRLRAIGLVDGAKRATHSLEEHIQRAIAKARETGTLAYHELPEPWKINPHIHTGYRFRESTMGCIQSAFGVSNETVNIWTHALGLFFILAVAFYFYPTSDNFGRYSNMDIAIAAIYFFAACKCMVCSTVWHTMNCVADKEKMETFACVDYTGISLLIAASIMTTEYTVFYCEPVSRFTYIGLTAALGVAGVVMPWHPTFNGPDYAWMRVAFFVGLGATGFLPVFQIAMQRGAAWALDFYMQSNLLISLSVYVAGACIYAAKIPERWWPGAFDYFGNAHNLWHIAVLGGIFYHYIAMQEFFSGALQRAQEGGCSVY